MFAKTLVLAGFVTALAWIPTAAADHTGQHCNALDGHEDLLVVYPAELYLQCLDVDGALPLAGLQKPALKLPVEIPQVNDAGCVAAPGFEVLCKVYDAAAQSLPLADSGCIASEGFEAVCHVYNVATQGLPLADAGCIAADGFEAVCTVYDATHVGVQPRAATGISAPAIVSPDCIALYPWSGVCDLAPL